MECKPCKGCKPFYFRHPFSAIIAGPSKSGKTEFTLRLLRNVSKMVRPRVTRVVYCYNNDQAAFHKMRGIEFHSNLDVLEELKTASRPTLLVLDDFMGSGHSELIRDFFTRYSHHSGVSVIYLTQNLYHKAKSAGYESVCQLFDSIQKPA